MPERIECVDDRRLLVADYPHFLEIDAGRRSGLEAGRARLRDDIHRKPPGPAYW